MTDRHDVGLQSLLEDPGHYPSLYDLILSQVRKLFQIRWPLGTEGFTTMLGYNLLTQMARIILSIHLPLLSFVVIMTPKLETGVRVRFLQDMIFDHLGPRPLEIV